jgi:hypothetical protein
MKRTILTYLTILFLASCSKDDETVEDPLAKLPPITQSGANTFACVVHNQVFLPRNGQGTIGGISGAKGVVLRGYNNQNYQNDITFDVGNFQDGKPMNTLFIHLREIRIKGIGDYMWNTATFQSWIDDGPLYDYMYCKVYDSSINAWKYYGSYENSGKVTITRYDFDNRVISGVFSGKLRERNGTREIEITHGRFDINRENIHTVYFP